MAPHDDQRLSQKIAAIVREQNGGLIAQVNELQFIKKLLGAIGMVVVLQLGIFLVSWGTVLNKVDNLKDQYNDLKKQIETLKK